jgi:iron(III) transport system substrate-binding protein
MSSAWALRDRNDAFRFYSTATGASIPIALIVVLGLLVSCSSTSKSASSSGSASVGAQPASLTLYTCVTNTVEQAVIKAFQQEHPGSKVNVFRAATGQLNARVAADVRSGGIKADVIWGCDPLTMHNYDSQGLLADWTPPSAAAINPAYRAAHFTGVALLYLIVVVHKGTPIPASWSDLTSPTYRGGVAIPSPTFAASALGMLGYFASAPGYGLTYYQALKTNGAKQVDSPDQVLTDVAQGSAKAGVTLANSAYAAQKKGSPIEIAWPKPGAISVYGAIGVTTRHGLSSAARPFADFVASQSGQAVLAKAGSYPVLSGLAGPPQPAGSPVVAPQWPPLFSQTKDLLARYSAIFPS